MPPSYSVHVLLYLATEAVFVVPLRAWRLFRLRKSQRRTEESDGKRTKNTSKDGSDSGSWSKTRFLWMYSDWIFVPEYQRKQTFVHFKLKTLSPHKEDLKTSHAPNLHDISMHSVYVGIKTTHWWSQTTKKTFILQGACWGEETFWKLVLHKQQRLWESVSWSAAAPCESRLLQSNCWHKKLTSKTLQLNCVQQSATPGKHTSSPSFIHCHVHISLHLFTN